LQRDMDHVLAGLGPETVQVPTLFIRGGKSKYITREDLPQLKEQFPRSRVETVPYAGHWVHAQAPEEVMDHSRAVSCTGASPPWRCCCSPLPCCTRSAGRTVCATAAPMSSATASTWISRPFATTPRASPSQPSPPPKANGSPTCAAPTASFFSRTAPGSRS